MIHFGTGGWRDVIGDGFTKANIRLVIAGLCKLMDAEGCRGAQICVGYDRRFLSKEAAHWAAEVLAGWGYRPYVVNRSSPTPLIMYTVRQMEMPYGLAVTASHNPAIYNGIKIFTRGGRDADQTVTGKIEEYIGGTDPEAIPAMDYDRALAQGIVQEGNPTNRYLDSVLSMVDTDAIRRAGLRIALDPMYGVSKSCLATILMTCRCELEIIHEQHDALFGGKMPAPNESALTPLRICVLDRYCNLGIATDGDADRLGVIDGSGNYVSANTLLVLLYYYLVKYRGWTGPCVRNNSTTTLLDRVAAGLGQRCYEVPVGFKYISAKMSETDAVIGGESSGGLAVRGHISGKDGIYAAALLVEMLAVTGKSLQALYREITDQYGELFYSDWDVRVTPGEKKTLGDRVLVRRELPDFGKAVANVSYADGCKVYFSDGSWVICRFSGTEPLLRFAAEGEAPGLAEEWIRIWRQSLGI